MNDLLKNPFVVFLTGLAALWLLFKLIQVVISFFWLFVLAFVVLFFINERFRSLVTIFFKSIFRNND